MNSGDEVQHEKQESLGVKTIFIKTFEAERGFPLNIYIYILSKKVKKEKINI